MERKLYSNSFRTLEAVWQVLRKHSSPQHPLTVKEICGHLREGPSPDTLDRLLPQGLSLMNELFPGLARQEGEAAEAETYWDSKGFHIVVETAAGEVLSRDGVELLAEEEPFRVPSYSTVDKLLAKLIPLKLDTYPFRLRCVAQIAGRDGRVRTIPYEAWEDRLHQAASREAAQELAAKGAVLSAEDREELIAKKKKRRNNVPRRYYLDNKLSDAEWRMFSDLVLVYPFLSEGQTHRFLRTLNALRPHPVHIPERFAYKRGSQRMMSLIQQLDQAILERRKVRILYGEYRLEQRKDGWKPVLRRRRSNGELEVEPWALMWSNGYYYLVARHREMMNLRADRILGVEVLEETFAPPDLDLVEYRNRSPVMYPGKSQYVRLRCRTSLLNTLLDFFGELPQYTAPAEGPQGAETTEVSMFIAPEGVKLFALQYAGSVEVLEPASLREQVAQTLREALEKYR